MLGHYTYVDGEKIWIPGCYSCLYSDGFCPCKIEKQKQAKMIKENDPEFKARKENAELWKENAALHRIIDKLKGKK